MMSGIKVELGGLMKTIAKRIIQLALVVTLLGILCFYFVEKRNLVQVFNFYNTTFDIVIKA